MTTQNDTAALQCALCKRTFEYEETGTLDNVPDGYFLNNASHDWICDACGSCPECGTTLEREPEKRGANARPCKDCIAAFPSQSLEELGLTFIELTEGYLIVQNQDGLYELWCRVDEAGAAGSWSERGADAVPLLVYETDLYSWGTSELDLSVLRRQVQHEIGKWKD